MEAPNTTPTELTTDDLLRAVLAEQQEHRAEVAALRAEIEKSKTPVPTVSATPQSPEELFTARMAQISEHSHYCPGCGLLYDYQQRCNGKAESPHPAIEVVSTDELKSGDTAQHSEAAYVNANPLAGVR